MPRKKDFNFDEMLGLDLGTEGPANAVEHSAHTGIQDATPIGSGQDNGLYPADGRDDLHEIIAALLTSHAGLRTGSAKKTTFDFTPEFARALKRWSVDVDTPMRDLVVKAVAQVIPTEYIQEYRNTGNQE
jgi:hypothetical protein